MKCPFCNYGDSRVIDSRSAEAGTTIRRRRECPKCLRRFTTYERYEETPLMVRKKNGNRELFDFQKLLSGLIKAFEKRPVSFEEIQEIGKKIERELSKSGESEVTTEQIGEEVMKQLEDVDKVAYVRFASVYRSFTDVNNFMQELERMVKKANLANKKEINKEIKK